MWTAWCTQVELSSVCETPLRIIRLLTYLGSNGALFMPNTHLMQKVTRMSNDYYLEEVESGKAAAEAHYLCIPKGD